MPVTCVYRYQHASNDGGGEGGIAGEGYFKRKTNWEVFRTASLVVVYTVGRNRTRVSLRASRSAHRELLLELLDLLLELPQHGVLGVLVDLGLWVGKGEVRSVELAGRTLPSRAHEGHLGNVKQKATSCTADRPCGPTGHCTLAWEVGLYQAHLVLDVLGAVGVAQRGHGLVIVPVGGADVGHHDRLGVAAEGVLQAARRTREYLVPFLMLLCRWLPSHSRRCSVRLGFVKLQKVWHPRPPAAGA